MNGQQPKLKLLPYKKYVPGSHDDPLRFYYWPVIGSMYRRRVELCLAECKGGERILEVGFGSGVTFLNLHDKYQEIYGLDLTAPVEEVNKLFLSMHICTYLQNGNLLDMPYQNNFFDTVLAISVLEHLKPGELTQAFQEIHRVLKPGGQLVYGVPVERQFMVWIFKIMGCDIRQHHFSTEKEVLAAAAGFLEKIKVAPMYASRRFRGQVYEVGHFVKG